MATDMDDATRTELEAAAFRGLAEHLRKRPHSQTLHNKSLPG